MYVYLDRKLSKRPFPADFTSLGSDRGCSEPIPVCDEGLSAQESSIQDGDVSPCESRKKHGATLWSLWAIAQLASLNPKP